VIRARKSAQSAPTGHCHGIAGQYPPTDRRGYLPVRVDQV
jgi:hypothetical protein